MALLRRHLHHVRDLLPHPERPGPATRVRIHRIAGAGGENQERVASRRARVSAVLDLRLEHDPARVARLLVRERRLGALDPRPGRTRHRLARPRRRGLLGPDRGSGRDPLGVEAALGVRPLRDGFRSDRNRSASDLARADPHLHLRLQARLDAHRRLLQFRHEQRG